MTTANTDIYILGMIPARGPRTTLLMSRGWWTLGPPGHWVQVHVFICPECTWDVVFSESAVDGNSGRVSKEFPCPNCDVPLTKRSLGRAWTSKYDDSLKETIQQAKQVPVLINYSIGKERFEKKPDNSDLARLKKIESSTIPISHFLF